MHPRERALSIRSPKHEDCAWNQGHGDLHFNGVRRPSVNMGSIAPLWPGGRHCSRHQRRHIWRGPLPSASCRPARLPMQDRVREGRDVEVSDVGEHLSTWLQEAIPGDQVALDHPVRKTQAAKESLRSPCRSSTFLHIRRLGPTQQAHQ